MPVRCRRSCEVAGSRGTFGASKAAGVEFCRRCWVRRRSMPVGIFVDSITYAGQVRKIGLLWNLGPLWSETGYLLVADR